jgi:hypothetical protein
LQSPQGDAPQRFRDDSGVHLGDARFAFAKNDGVFNDRRASQFNSVRDLDLKTVPAG